MIGSRAAWTDVAKAICSHNIKERRKVFIICPL